VSANLFFNQRTKAAALGWLFVLLCTIGAAAQNGSTPKGVKGTTKNVPAKLPTVTQIDEAGLKKLLQPNGKPLLINFWATWCDPCREEFPDLVKLDAEYKGKIDFNTVSFDDLAEIGRDVPQFLNEMKAEMPAYLLKVPDEDAAIKAISPDWRGGLPFTILVGIDGKISYFRQGKVIPATLRTEINKTLPPTGEITK
jgi:thiol-disulfide isomerase/thioredoxin